ncbi:MAG: MmcQ/YjbR family DNA-binding protein [Saprospiraceae bacterium]
MNIDQLRNYCLSKPDTTESLPFGPDTLVYAVKGKLFALTSVTSDRPRVNLKCNPDYAIELRDQYDEIIPGWHMNKKHWNTVYLDGHLKTSLIQQLIDHSYEQVIAKMPRSKQK